MTSPQLQKPKPRVNTKVSLSSVSVWSNTDFSGSLVGESNALNCNEDSKAAEERPFEPRFQSDSNECTPLGADLDDSICESAETSGQDDCDQPAPEETSSEEEVEALAASNFSFRPSLTTIWMVDYAITREPKEPDKL